MPLACFKCADTFASKHAKGMSLRYDAILALSDNLISEDWFFAEGEWFLSFWRSQKAVFFMFFVAQWKISGDRYAMLPNR